MTEALSGWNSRNLAKQNSVDGGVFGGSLRKKAKPWLRRSFRSLRINRQTPNGVTHGGTSLIGVTRTHSSSLVDYTNPERTCVVVKKQDNESFGFEIQTYGLQQKNSTEVETCTSVSKVYEDSPAQRAGLTAGDAIVMVSGVCIEGLPHQRVVDLIRDSANLLRMETVNGVAVKRIELEKKRRQLKQTLREKWEELQRLTLEELRLTQGDLNSSYTSLDSLMSLGSSVSQGHRRFSSESSSLLGEEDVFPCVFEEPTSPAGRERSLSSTDSVGSSMCLSPSSSLWAVSSVFGTMPRSSKRASVRRQVMKFLPGLGQSLEEEEVETS